MNFFKTAEQTWANIAFSLFTNSHSFNIENQGTLNQGTLNQGTLNQIVKSQVCLHTDDET